jgi:hypothetical protein
MPVIPSGQVASFSNGTMAIGTVVPAPPTISTVSCARAGNVDNSATTRSEQKMRTMRRKRFLG